MQPVVVVGHVNWDITLIADTIPPADGETTLKETYAGPGGSAANVAVGLATLGETSRLIGSVGTDDVGHRVRTYLTDQGVDTAAVQRVSGTTTKKYILVTEGGTVRVFGDSGVNEATSLQAVPEDVFVDAGHLHVTSHRPQFLQALLNWTDTNEITISADLGRQGASEPVTAVVERADLIFGTKQELTTLFGSPEDGVTENRTVVCTRGADGATVYTATETYDHTGIDKPVVDTTGAGDAFVAGFLTQWHRNREVPVALAAGNACGAYASTRRGTRFTLDTDLLPETPHEQS